jgi:hypothetical protein
MTDGVNSNAVPLTFQLHTPDTDDSTFNVLTDEVPRDLSALTGMLRIQVFYDVTLHLHFISLLNSKNEGVCNIQIPHIHT